MTRKLGIWVGLFCALIATAPGQGDLAGEAQAVLASSCYGCHGPQQQMGRLRLDLRPAALAKAIVAGDAPTVR